MLFFQKTEVKQHIARSLSAPLNAKPKVLRRLDSVGLIRVVSAGPQYAGTGDTSVSQTKESGNDIGCFYCIIKTLAIFCAILLELLYALLL